MNALNSIIIEGNLTKDPVMNKTPKGTAVSSFTIGHNRSFKPSGSETYEQEASFFEIETWGRLAETCFEKLSKGRGVRVVGRLKQDRWKDDNGNPQSRVKIVAEHVEFKPVFKSSEETSQPEEAPVEEEIF